MKYKYIISILVFSITITYLGFILYDAQNNSLENLKSQVESILNNKATLIQSTLNEIEAKTNTLDLLIADEHGSINSFERVAEELYDKDTIYSIQLAPNGIVENIYSENNVATSFNNLYENDYLKEDVQLAKNNNIDIISDPFMVDNIQVISVINPIYINDYFWGFSLITIEIPKVFEEYALSDLKPRSFLCELSYAENDTPFYQNSDIALTNPTSLTFSVLNKTWTLKIAPKDGWTTQDNVLINSFLDVLISLLVGMMVWFIFTLMEQKEMLRRLTMRDPLTKVYNRRKLDLDLDEYCKEKIPFTFAYIDIDKFKEVNDTYGHAGGDAILINVCESIKKYLSNKDSVYRVGGDEFAIVIYENEDKKINNIIDTIRIPIMFEGKKIKSSVSVGVIHYPKDATSKDKLISIADEAMYKIKNQNRNKQGR